MLNPFPILFLSMLAHFLLRLMVGLMLLFFGFKHITRRYDLQHTFSSIPWFPYGNVSVWILALTEIITGSMFILGFFTQFAALITMVLSLKMILFYRYFASEYVPGRMFYVLLFAASLSLFITGAGAFAFDLPI